MADLTIEYRYTCPSNISWAKTVIGSKGDKYIVSFHGDGLVQWQCTCPGFKFKGECKHIKKAEKERCGWNWEAYCGGGAQPKPDPKKPGGFGLCPMCNEEVQIIKVGV